MKKILEQCLAVLVLIGMAILLESCKTGCGCPMH